MFTQRHTALGDSSPFKPALASSLSPNKNTPTKRKMGSKDNTPTKVGASPAKNTSTPAIRILTTVKRQLAFPDSPTSQDSPEDKSLFSFEKGYLIPKKSNLMLELENSIYSQLMLALNNAKAAVIASGVERESVEQASLELSKMILKNLHDVISKDSEVEVNLLLQEKKAKWNYQSKTFKSLTEKLQEKGLEEALQEQIKLQQGDALADPLKTVKELLLVSKTLETQELIKAEQISLRFRLRPKPIIYGPTLHEGFEFPPEGTVFPERILNSPAMKIFQKNIPEMIKNWVDANATAVLLTITEKAEGVEICLKDNGDGFPLKSFKGQDPTARVSYGTLLVAVDEQDPEKREIALQKIRSEKIVGKSFGGAGRGLAAIHRNLNNPTDKGGVDFHNNKESRGASVIIHSTVKKTRQNLMFSPISSTAGLLGTFNLADRAASPIRQENLLSAPEQDEDDDTPMIATAPTSLVSKEDDYVARAKLLAAAYEASSDSSSSDEDEPETSAKRRRRKL